MNEVEQLVIKNLLLWGFKEKVSFRTSKIDIAIYF